jgi:hypothetical protein
VGRVVLEGTGYLRAPTPIPPGTVGGDSLRDPLGAANGFQARAEYLSRNVWEKLDAALAAGDDRFDADVGALGVRRRAVFPSYAFLLILSLNRFGYLAEESPGSHMTRPPAKMNSIRSARATAMNQRTPLCTPFGKIRTPSQSVEDEDQHSDGRAW